MMDSSAARMAVRRIRERGGATYYGEAHLAARLHLGFFEEAPVACTRCPATEATVGGLISGIHAALDWKNVPAARLRVDYAGKIFSSRPDLDYIPLCARCHRRHDSWHKALPQEIQDAIQHQLGHQHLSTTEIYLRDIAPAEVIALGRADTWEDE